MLKVYGEYLVLIKGIREVLGVKGIRGVLGVKGIREVLGVKGIRGSTWC